MREPAKSHPAKYSDRLLPIFVAELIGYEKIIDPMAGTGKLRLIRPDAYMVEKEPEWAEIGGATVGDAHALPWLDNFFDAVITSPTYGNRFSDHHDAKDGSVRRSYTHDLGRKLSPNNSGQLQWGREYRQFHRLAWLEVRRVLRPEGKFILNISNHIRKGKEIKVTRFHHLLLLRLGFVLENSYRIETPRLRYGQNAGRRVAFESVLVYRIEKYETDPNLNVLMNYWPSLENCPDGTDPFPELPVSGIVLFGRE